MCCDRNCNKFTSCLNLVPIFQGMSTNEINNLQQVTKSRCFKKGELIFREGEQSDKFFIVHKGLIKLSKVAENGKEQILRLLFQGDFFGQFALLKDENYYANAEALENTIVCTIEKKLFVDTIERNPTMAVNFINALSNRLVLADEWMSLLSLLEVEQRLARVIILFYDRIGMSENQFTLPISKRDLASFIGTTPETLSRKLMSFVGQQLISLKQRRDIQVVDYNKLKTLAGN